MQYLKQDLERYLQFFDPKTTMVKKYIKLILTPGVQAICTYRFGQWVKSLPKSIRLMSGLYFLSFLLHRRIMKIWGIELPRDAQIGPGLYIGHFGGIIISPSVVIGKNFNISQGVTIGVSGSGENRGVPVIGDNVYVGAGAKIIGKIKIGDNVKIGANAVVYKDVPDNAIVVLDGAFKLLKINE